MYNTLEKFVENLDFSHIQAERIVLLDEIASYLQPRFLAGDRINVICICTHNSRRSHLCQVWSKAAAMYYRVRKFNSYSGGTEVTAVNEQIILSLARQGFKVTTLSDQENPVYALKYAYDLPAMHLFSKKYNNTYNPNKDFIAFMNCDHADQNCPIVVGAKVRFALNYQDPKWSDGGSTQEKVYFETSQQIGREMFYLFSKFK